MSAADTDSPGLRFSTSAATTATLSSLLNSFPDSVAFLASSIALSFSACSASLAAFSAAIFSSAAFCLSASDLAFASS